MAYERWCCVCFCVLVLFCCFFFFQAEDGIRDKLVTGVQTCALPISASGTLELGGIGTCPHTPWPPFFTLSISLASAALSPRRSEERRVGKSVDLGGRRIIKKKKKKEITSRYREINMRAEAGREDSEM